MYNKSNISDLLKSDLLKDKKESLYYVDAPVFQDSNWYAECKSDFDACSSAFVSHKCDEYRWENDIRDRGICLGICSLEKIHGFKLSNWEYLQMITSMYDTHFYMFNMTFKSSITNQVTPRLAFMALSYESYHLSDFGRIKVDLSSMDKVDQISANDYLSINGNQIRYTVKLPFSLYMHVDLCSMQSPDSGFKKHVVSWLKNYITNNYNDQLECLGSDMMYFKSSINVSALKGDYTGDRTILVCISNQQDKV